jgi:hypothetical protein
MRSVCSTGRTGIAGFVAGHRTLQPGVHLARGKAIFFRGEVVAARPPGSQLAPGQPGLSQRPVIDQAVPGVLGDLQESETRPLAGRPVERAGLGPGLVLVWSHISGSAWQWLTANAGVSKRV